LRLKAVNNIEFYTQSNQRVLIDSSGNVYIAGKLGVKNSSPYYEVDVLGSIRASNNLIAFGVLDLEGAMGALICHSGLIRQSGYDLVLGTETANNIRFITNNLGRVIIDSTGRVGIGVSSFHPSLPASGLEVLGIIYTHDDAVIGFRQGQEGGVYIAGEHVYGRPSIQGVSNTQQPYDLLLNPQGGNVGIGTTAPTAKLHIQGATGYNQLRLATSYTPTGTRDPNGNVGDFAWNDNYLYIKTRVGWKRVALSTF
jgi:hypothetical protein